MQNADSVKQALEDVVNDAAGGFHLRDLKIGWVLKVQTNNTLYTIEKTTDGYLISGHPRYCPFPIRTTAPGSSWGGCVVRDEFLGLGMRMVFEPQGKRDSVITTGIQRIQVVAG